MSDDSRSPSNGIPSWQRVPSSSQPTADTQQPPQQSPQKEEELKPRDVSNDEAKIGEDEALVRKAKLFLENDTVKDEPTKKKVAFLRSQGLSESAINSAIHDATPPSPSSSAPVEARSSSLAHTQTKDVPPIITYPEFLMHANKPPPLITASRLMSVAYVASGAAAAIYGLSKYLVGPMTDSLQASRHDFAVNAQARVEDLNSRLGNVISVDPDQASGNKCLQSRQLNAEDYTSNADSDDSDPTELFHRDFGTQTSAIQSPKPKSSASSSSGELIVTGDSSTELQTSQLKHLSDLCKELGAENDSEGDTNQEISTILKVVQEHLESLNLPTNAFTANAMYDAYGLPKDGKKDEDEVSKIKSEIRSVKGVLLSARNFPGGRRANFPQTASAG